MKYCNKCDNEETPAGPTDLHWMCRLQKPPLEFIEKPDHQWQACGGTQQGAAECVKCGLWTMAAFRTLPVGPCDERLKGKQTNLRY